MTDLHDDVLSTEDAVRAIWAEALGGAIDDDSDFFLLAGSSAAALTITSRIEELSGVRPPLRMLFEYPRFGDYVRALLEKGR
ncbi:phosphopantetheine-binding protein [Actinocrispum sp. NPDC049592]|uniref:phosphopantetheine-binding protein n=1 Tax=Actinocrispum sp. NPDC049592 TaxID=3154835 RepID=UPI00341625D5